MRDPIKIAVLMLTTLGLASGCGAIAAGTAGGVIATEATEDDGGNIDPLENTAAGDELEAAGDVIEAPIDAVDRAAE